MLLRCDPILGQRLEFSGVMAQFGGARSRALQIISYEKSFPNEFGSNGSDRWVDLSEQALPNMKVIQAGSLFTVAPSVVGFVGIMYAPLLPE
jgi:hypothetical protein